MILHGVHYRKFDIKQEDTLEHPQHLNDLPFEAIVANPPFSAEWSANPLFTSDDRFSQYGKLAPSSKADFAFVQHMIHHLAENGTMAIVLPHGALFRGGAEQHIRKYLIENRNYLDAVIGLPANIFYGTSIPTCIMVFKKCRENPNDILFIDASNDFEKVKTQNILRNEHIDKIIKHYRERKETPKYSKRILIADVDGNVQTHDGIVQTHDLIVETHGRASLQQTHDGIVQTHDGIVQTHDGIIQTHDGMVKTHDGVVQTHDGIVQTHGGIVQTHDGIVQTHDGIVQTHDGMVQTHGPIVETHGRVSLQNTIAKNDYNLNIPRYVDTFEAEENIDIDAIANELKALDASMKNTDETIAQFCAELNIVTPF